MFWLLCSRCVFTIKLSAYRPLAQPNESCAVGAFFLTPRDMANGRRFRSKLGLRDGEHAQKAGATYYGSLFKLSRPTVHTTPAATIASCYDQSYPLGRSCTTNRVHWKPSRQLLVRSSVVKTAPSRWVRNPPSIHIFLLFLLLSFHHSTRSVLFRGPSCFHLPSLSSPSRRPARRMHHLSLASTPTGAQEMAFYFNYGLPHSLQSRQRSFYSPCGVSLPFPAFLIPSPYV